MLGQFVTVQLILFVSSSFNVFTVSLYYLCHQKAVSILNTNKSISSSIFSRGVVKMGWDVDGTRVSLLFFFFSIFAFSV